MYLLYSQVGNTHQMFALAPICCYHVQPAGKKKSDLFILNLNFWREGPSSPIPWVFLNLHFFLVFFLRWINETLKEKYVRESFHGCQILKLWVGRPGISPVVN